MLSQTEHNTHHGESAEWVALRANDCEPREPMMEVPEGLMVGRPLRVLSVGPIRTRSDGEVITALTLEHLTDMARLVVERADHDPVVIDWGHSSSPAFPASGDARQAGSLGQVVGAYVEDMNDGRGPGLYVIPAYTESGVEVVRKNAGVLWTSPELYPREVYARSGDEKTRLGSAQLLALALTNRPAQAASAVDRVVLTEGGIPAPNPEEVEMSEDNNTANEMEPEGMSPEQFTAALKAKDEEIMGLRAYISDMEEQMAQQATGLSEKTASAALVDSLNAKVTRLSEDLAAEKAKREKAEDDAVATAWLSDGRITPAERDGFIVALSEKRHGRAQFYEFTFANRTPGQAIPLGEKGHAEAVKPGSSAAEADRLIRAYAETHCGGDYRAAYKHLKDTDPAIQAMLNGGH